jgi:transposase InsO family protein
MRTEHPTVRLGAICWLFGVSRQAYYQHLYEHTSVEVKHELLIKEVLSIRKQHPCMGTRKLYLMLEPFMEAHSIKMGRDALFDLLSVHHLLMRKRRRRVKTTLSHHWLKKYSNLIIGFEPAKPNELWVSDITYWKIGSDFVYISLITDAFSHKIVGYNLAETLEAVESVQALKMALSDLSSESHFKLIHHSDRGVQYCSAAYVKLLNKDHIQISMSENGDPLENAIAERVNGILKEEYLDCYEVCTVQEAKELLTQVVRLYNEQRPHMSNGNIAPEKVHSQQEKKGKNKWKNYYQKNKLSTDFSTNFDPTTPVRI